MLQTASVTPAYRSSSAGYRMMLACECIDGIRATSQAEVAMAMKGRGRAEWQERLLTVLSGPVNENLPFLFLKYIFCCEVPPRW